LKEGEMKTVREGINGSYNLNYSQKIKNGQADGDADTSKTDEVAPVSKIIEIGSKPASDTITITKGIEYELDYSRKDGEPVVVEEGNDGVITIKTTRNPDTGEITITQEVTTEVKNKKIKIPAGTEGKHEYTEKIPFKYEIEYDENLKSGEYVVDVPGSEGSKTTTWNIVNSKVDGEPDVKVKDPVNAKIRVGKKDFTGEVKHTEKIETPFEVEYRYSDELEAGQTKVEQEGKNGSYDLEYSQNIKNGQADGKATTEKKNEVEAQKKIVVIGTKPIVDKVEKGFNTEYIYDDTLEAGKIEEKTPGKNGQTTITHYYDKDKKEIVTEEKTENPTNRVVRVGIKPIEEGTELPFETEYVYDENMEAGKTEVTQEGKKGKAKITTFFNKETGKLETKIEREEPTKKIVKYGSKTEGEVKIKDDIAYEVEIIEDPEMEAGKTEVVQDGKNGTKETTITIENSKEINRETNVIEEPIKKIIKVGTKNVCDIPEQPDKPEEPDTPDKPEGPDEPDKPNEPGKEEPGTPDKPEEPSTPDKPTVPDEPSVPGEPSVPETPNEPNGGGTTVTEEKPSEKEEAPEEESEKSEEKVEEKAEDSDVESKEDKVDETEEVVEDNIKTSVGNNDSDGADENKRLPKTGDGVNRSLYAYMMGLMGSAMMAIGVKKKNKESLDEE
ncbi:MAG: G5 domain-containing protein, partial [Eubacteriales bacterium]|nr:G5 domain-containing protein [Eubacteriales bacterium]